MLADIAVAASVPLVGLAAWLAQARVPAMDPAILAFLATAALAAALTLLAIVRHAQRILRQLGLLTAALRDAVRGNFPARPVPLSKDEFGSAARILNRLTDDLALRHAVQGTLARIDEALFVKPDERTLVRGALQCVERLTSAEVTAFARFESLAEATATVHLAFRNGRGRLESQRLEFDANLVGRLAAPTTSSTQANSPFPYELTRRLYKECGVQHFFVFPVARGSRQFGFLISGHRAPATLLRARIRLLREVCNRLVAGFHGIQREELLHSLAFVDRLTGLPNRASFESTVNQRLQGVPGQQAAIAVLLLNIDRFKLINGTFGHATGDRLLIEVRRRIQPHLLEQDVLARVGGDEFAALLAQTDSHRDAAHVARKIIRSLSRSIDIDGNRIYTGASAGIAQVGTDGLNAVDLLRTAEIAMYRAKAEGRNRFVFYEAAMNADGKRLSRLDRELRKALRRNELILHYRPRFDLATDALCGVVALLRWQHPERGMLFPTDFIADAETMGLLPEIGAWAMKEACLQHKKWRDSGFLAPRLVVKIFSGQLARSKFLPMVRQIQAETGMPAGEMEIEVAGAMLADAEPRTWDALRQLAAEGLPIAIDDFGTGSSAIACLKSGPVRVLKLDLGAVADVSSDDDAIRIVHALVDMAHALKKEVVAEGIDRPEQLLLLKTLGCDRGEGSLLGKPSAPGHIEQAMLKRPNRSSLCADGALEHGPAARISAPLPKALELRPAMPTARTELKPEDAELLGARLTVPRFIAEDYPTIPGG